jgi:hypothetical protein
MYVYVTSVIANSYVVSICMYLYVFACIWIANDKLQSTPQQSFPKLHSSDHTINKGTQGHSVLAKSLFILHFSLFISKLHCSERSINKGTQGHFVLAKRFFYCSFLNLLVVNWPNHGPGVDVEQGAS